MKAKDHHNTSFSTETKTSNEKDNKDCEKIVLVGNPNVGKSVVFGALTGVYVEVSNYPGTTIDITQGKVNNFTIIDTPGVYGISDYSEEEKATKDIVLQHKRILNVVSAVSIEKDLFLTQQLIDMGCEIIVAINQMDEAECRGICIDIEALKKALGVDVFPMVATRKIGVETLKNNLNCTKKGNVIEKIQSYRDKYVTKGVNPADAILALEGDTTIAAKYDDIDFEDKKEELYTLRREHINNIYDSCITETTVGTCFSTKLGMLILNPIIGTLTALLVLFILYEVIGVFVAGEIVGFTEALVTEHYIPWVTHLISSIIPFDWLVQILAGEFGILTMTVQIVAGVLLPLVIGFFIFFAILEDSGYLPRLAVLCDRLFSYIGLNGSAIIPIILGFGCITMAVVSSRVLRSQRERIIAIAILALTVPCSAQVAIILALLASAKVPWAWPVYLVTIITIMLLVSFLLNKYLPGESSALMLDLPPMRIPNTKNVLKKGLSKSWGFLKEAVPYFTAGTFILAVLGITGGLEFIQHMLSPIIVSFLNLPEESTNAFLMGLIRRDFGASGLANLAGIGTQESIMTPIQIVVSLIVITLFVPCIAAVMVIFKERGLFETVLLWVFSIVIAFLTGGLVSFILNMVF